MPAEQFRMTMVTTVRNEPHMVLAWYSVDSERPFILDNAWGWVEPATERGDLEPMYSFVGEASLISDGSYRNNYKVACSS